MGLANNIGTALSAFSGALVAQSSAQSPPKEAVPVSEANGLNEGLLGLAYDVGTAPMAYAKGTSDVPPVQSLSSLPTE